MLRRSNRDRGVSAGIISRHPREAVALFVGGSAIMIICANALFMQPGPHPAPIFSRSTLAPSRAAGPMAPAPISPQPSRFEPAQIDKLPPARPVEADTAKPSKPVATSEAPRNDPIAQLLSPSKRVIAVQRILTAYGYGQIKPTGAVDSPTEQAIRKFEASRKMPVTGQVSDQLVRALSAMSGQQID